MSSRLNVANHDVHVASIETTGQTLKTNYQFNGRLGSQSVRWSDEDIATQDYAPYGEQMDKENIHEGTYGFTSHEDDTDTDSTYMKARL